ncbi:hypothetical protein [Micromonospora sp. WMMD1219]|uniref:hypothetical protein n=1 Tax=Micromonospora sp. WMMD1219 TaxID=3404115 RepID=UPI003BF4AD7C
MIWAQERPEARPDVRRRVAMEADRLGVPLANLGSRYSATARGSYTAFSCASCNALFGDWYLREYVMEARAEDARSSSSRFQAAAAGSSNHTGAAMPGRASALTVNRRLP